MQIYFNELKHTYTDELDRKYKPATKFLKQFKKPFDSANISKAVAKKEERTQQEVLVEWSFVGHLACDWGTNIHHMLEYGVEHPKWTPKNLFYAKVLTNVRAILETVPKHKKIITEKILHDEDNLIAGTADLVIVDVEKKTAEIWDYKTNVLDAQIYNKYLDPISHLKESKINEYSLQLSLYAHMIEKQGFKVSKLNLLNVDYFGDVKVIEVENLKKEIGLLLTK